jgi:hypothetical protein
MWPMRSWPTSWPDAVRQFYESLADEFGWSDYVVEGVSANVEYLRGLDASDRERAYFSGDAEGERWLFEAVDDGGRFVVIRQVVIDAGGGVHRYSWRRREDEHGGLTDQAIEPTDGLERGEVSEFIDAWRYD